MPVSSFSDPYSAEALEIQRRRQLAETLGSQQSGLAGPTEMVSGWAVKKSPFEGLADMLRKYTAGEQGRRADVDLKALRERYQGDRSADMQAIASMLKGSPGGVQADAADNVTQMPAQKAGIDPAGLGQLRTPEMQGMGMNVLAQQMARENAPPEKIDLGDKWGFMKNGVLVGSIPKGATPDAKLKEEGSDRRHAAPSGSAQLGSRTTLATHATPSGGALLADQRARSEGALGRGVTVRGQDLTNARAVEQAARDKFGAPTEVSGPNGPMLALQNKTTGAFHDANTLQPVGGPIGPKVGETAQKQQTGVVNTQAAIKEYRDALKTMNPAEIASPNARARMGTVYNNMLLQAKEAYNLGVLNGPDYMILQEVITNPMSMTGSMTSKKALDDQAKKLDQIMGKIGSQIVQTQTGQDRRRADDDPLGLRKNP